MDMLENQSFTEAAIQEYKEGLGIFTKKMPKIAEAYNQFTEACFSEGKVSQKVKQMIALGISIYAQDEYCIMFHTKGCLEQGCSADEILETVGVAAAFGGGAAMSQAVTLVQQSIEELQNHPQKH
jgi:AhpD family alkylhydroperoxidase